MSNIAEIVQQLRANTGLLYIRTHEESRFISDLYSELQNKEHSSNMCFYSNCWVGSNDDYTFNLNIWSLEGLCCYESNPALPMKSPCWHLVSSGRSRLDTPNKAYTTPIQIIDYITGIKTLKSGNIFVLKDFASLFQAYSGLARRVKELIDNGIYAHKRIIMLAPEFPTNYPSILDKDTVVMDYSLPNKDAVHLVVTNFINDLGDSKIPNIQMSYTDKEVNRMVAACTGLTTKEMDTAMTLSLVRYSKLDSDSLLTSKRHIVSKNRVIEYIEPNSTIEDIGGLDILKEYIRRYAQVFSPEAKAFGVEPPRGILLTGIPGTGKSLAAKTCSSLWHIPCLRLDLGRVMGKYVGESENNIHNAFRLAEAVAPAVLWFDEIEKSIGTKLSQSGDSGTSSRVFGTILTWMQEHKEDIVVIATSNDISEIPPELIRRFDEVFFLDLPSPAERMEIIDIHLRKRGRKLARKEVITIVNKSMDYTGAEIEKAIRGGIAKAFYNKEKIVTTDNIIEALLETKPIAHLLKEQIDIIRNWANGRAHRASPE